MNSTQFGLQGIEELTAKFGAINYDLKFKGGRFSLRKAADIVRISAKKNAYKINDWETANTIAENVVLRFSNKRFKSSGDLMFRVGVLGGARLTSEAQRRRKRRKSGAGLTLEELGEISGKGKDNPGGDTFYWRFVEFGTEKTSAHPFMRPALENNVSSATKEFVSQYGKSMNRAIKKASKVNS